MIDLTLPLWALVLPVLVSPLQSEPGAEEPQPRSTPAIEQPADTENVKRQISVDEAIRRAREALDAIEESSDPDEMTLLLESVDQYIAVVERGDSTNAWLPYLYGRAFSFAGRRGDAVNELRKFVSSRTGQNEWRAHLALGDLFVGDFPDLARRSYEEAASLNPGESRVLAGLARCAVKRGDLDEGIRLARQVVGTRGGRTARNVAFLAMLLKGMGEWDQSLREADRAVMLARDLVTDSPGERGPVVRLDAQYKLVIDILQAKINEPDHKSGDDYLRLAATIRQRGEVTSMLILHDVQRAIEIGIAKTSPNPPSALLQEYALVLTEAGNTQKAIQMFEKLLEVDPSNTVAPQWLSRLRPADPNTDATPESP